MPPRKGRYHHGNLREELLRVSRELIAEKSPQGFLMSDAAKAAGVSAAAPYRHFKGKDDLIAAVALEGFLHFADVLGEATAKPREPIDSMLALGDAYLKFAREHQGEYMAMFESGLNVAGSAELSHAAEAAFEPIRAVAERVLNPLETSARPPVNMVAQHVLSMAHGTAEIFGRNEGNLSAFSPQDLLESSLRIYLNGLGVY